jgi:hypothetical protein
MSVLTAQAPPRGLQRYLLESELERMTPAERATRGKEARAAVPRDSHAMFDPGPGRSTTRCGTTRLSWWRAARRGCRASRPPEAGPSRFEEAELTGPGDGLAA